mmetsp:Transcript_11111/g.20622  ORF Transcript_11111/g.20622 Transcript_11111/m.20622 type:complete len:564 (-) Transcript_11111:1228-2919(-)
MVRVLSIKTISILLVTGTGVEAETFPFTRSLVALLPKGLDRNHRVPSCTMVDFDGTSNSARTSQKLGCAILESSIHGMFKASTNILALNDMLDLNDKLFSNHDVVRMIDDGCIHIIHHGNGGIYSERSVQYASKLEYSEAYKETLDIGTSNKFSFGRTSASLSYDTQSSESYTAAGQKGLSEVTAFWELEVATVWNNCIKPCMEGMESGCINAYALPSVLGKWDDIISNPNDGAKVDDFVRNHGVVIPNSWSYGDVQSATLSVEYDTSSMISSQVVSHAMSSSLSSAYGELSGGVQAGMESGFESVIDTSSENIKLNYHSHNMPSVKAVRCKPYEMDDVERQDCVSDYHADAGTWGSPYKIKSFVSVGDVFVGSQITRDKIAVSLAAVNAIETKLPEEDSPKHALSATINGLKHYYSCSHYKESESALTKACRWKYEPVPSVLYIFERARDDEYRLKAYDTKLLGYGSGIDSAYLGFVGLDAAGRENARLRVGTRGKSKNQDTWAHNNATGHLCRGDKKYCIDTTGNIVYGSSRQPAEVTLEPYDTMLGMYDSFKLVYNGKKK